MAQLYFEFDVPGAVEDSGAGCGKPDAVLDKWEVRLTNGDIGEDFPDLSIFGLTPNAVDRIVLNLERYQALHAVAASGIGVITLFFLIAAIIAPGSALISGTLSALFGAACVHFLLPSMDSDRYWAEHPVDLRRLQLFERWWGLKSKYLHLCQLAEAERRRIEQEQRRLIAIETAAIEHARRLAVSVDEQIEKERTRAEVSTNDTPQTSQWHSAHIVELLAGIDEDVRLAFFNLNPDARHKLMQIYGNRFGEGARKWAEATWPKWKAGTVCMTGRVAERLLMLVPHFMSLPDRYELLKKLLNQHRPRQYRVVECMASSWKDAVIPVIEELLSTAEYALPNTLIRRVEWLMDDDAIAARHLLEAVAKAEASVQLRYLNEEYLHIEELVRTLPGRISITHRIELPQGTVQVSILPPKRNFLNWN